jgi:putative nucleotidyltransferase with HDIG domain
MAQFFERNVRLSPETTSRIVRRAVIVLATATFVLLATIMVAFDDIFPGSTALATLQVGDIAPRDIHAPETSSFQSQVLTAQRQQAARDAVSPIYDPPDPNVARQQTQLARQILDYIDNVRHDPYGTPEQKTRDINQITALTLDQPIISHILEISNDTWKDVDDQITSVLERVMRESIRETDLRMFIDQLPTQVSVRFSGDDAAVIVAVIADLVRPNRLANPAATEDARNAAAAAIQPVERSFERGQIVVREGERVDDAALEALIQLGLLKPADHGLQGLVRAFLASVVVAVVIGLYTARFESSLIHRNPRLLTLLAVLFLIALIGARFLGVNGQIYLYPSAALALLFVTIIGPEIAITSSLGLALLIGLMAGNSLEITAMVMVGGIIGALTIRRAERLNSYFFAGSMVAVVNMAIVAIFNLEGAPIGGGDFPVLVVYSLLNGILSAAVAFAGMYGVTLLFNLPTSLKLMELSQPNQPLLQRLLREAPGTYQHSLQVANLSEQAANAIGVNAELVRVAALYHDIGKMLNPFFFTENQRDVGNPHDSLNDPYRSADIIIGHVLQGDDLARQNRLPNRIRDFIREHHGTTLVWVFYQKALEQAGGDESALDARAFTYPGPKPQSCETGIMLLADSCEATVRARQPKNRQEVADLVREIVEDKRATGQLDESGLTLNDLKTIQNIFIEMLQAVFHPRINYPPTPARVPRVELPPKPTSRPDLKYASQEAKPSAPAETEKSQEIPQVSAPVAPDTTPKRPAPVPNGKSSKLADDEAPLPDVPPLPRTGEFRAIRTNNNDKTDEQPPAPEEKDHRGDGRSNSE